MVFSLQDTANEIRLKMLCSELIPDEETRASDSRQMGQTEFLELSRKTSRPTRIRVGK